RAASRMCSAPPAAPSCSPARRWLNPVAPRPIPWCQAAAPSRCSTAAPRLARSSIPAARSRSAPVAPSAGSVWRAAGPWEVSAATVTNTTVLSGGTLELLDGATESGTIINAGGTFEIGSGQTLSGFEVTSGVILEAALGGTLVDTTLDSGGTAIVLSGGVDSGA